MNQTRNSIKTIISICIGNTMEWYDFMVYNYMLLFIAQAYFPHQNGMTSLLATMASSGVALVVRPIGGILLSIWADKHGPHKALMGIFYLMTLATALITFTPDFAQIGIFSPILLVCARLIQGLAAGGEFGISSTLLATLSPYGSKGFYTSWQMVGQLLALLFGSSICFLLTVFCSKEVLFQYAWRIPFLLGLVILPIGLVLRRQLQQHHVPDKPSKPSMPILKIIRDQKAHLAVGLGLVIGCTGSVYTLFSYMPVFSKVYLNFSLHDAYLGPLAGLTVSIITIPAFGALSDKLGKKPILICSLFVYVCLIHPLLGFLPQHANLATLIVIESVLGLFIGAYFGILTAILSELFPQKIRATCLALSYNSAVLLFGGFAPLIITALIERTKNPMVFSYYLMVAVSISCIAAIFYKEKTYNISDAELEPLYSATH